jgi:endonuclease/exonuclease/phosphatase family metal-dependent hydrolase
MGEVRLGKLRDAELANLAARLAPDSPRDTRAEQLRAVLNAKRRHARAARSPKSVLRPVSEAASPSSESGESESDWDDLDLAEPTTPPPRLTLPMALSAKARGKQPQRIVFAPAPEALVVIAFNTLGLRDHDDATRDEWAVAAEVLASADVLLLSEVPPAALRTRVPTLKAQLEAASGVTWSWLHSLPCTGGAVGGKVEHHVALAKAPLKLASSQTLSSIGGCKLDYGLFTVRVEGHALACNGEVMDVVLSSLHMPPAKRANMRDRQLERLLTQYPLQADARLATPFGAHAAHEARRPFCAHALLGDFNRHPGELLTPDWRALIPRAAATSGGGGAYDNIVVSADTAERANCSWEVLRLDHYANARTGQKGISDHAPVQLTLKSIGSGGNNYHNHSHYTRSTTSALGGSGTGTSSASAGSGAGSGASDS